MCFTMVQMIKQKSFDKYIGLYLKDEKLVYEVIHERWSVGVALSTTDKFEQISFVNGIATPKGGKYVDSITKQIVQPLTTHIEKKEKTKVKENYIKNYLRFSLMLQLKIHLLIVKQKRD